jgi:hypothetical protein
MEVMAPHHPSLRLHSSAHEQVHLRSEFVDVGLQHVFPACKGQACILLPAFLVLSRMCVVDDGKCFARIDRKEVCGAYSSTYRVNLREASIKDSHDSIVGRSGRGGRDEVDEVAAVDSMC